MEKYLSDIHLLKIIGLKLFWPSQPIASVDISSWKSITHKEGNIFKSRQPSPQDEDSINSGKAELWTPDGITEPLEDQH